MAGGVACARGNPPAEGPAPAPASGPGSGSVEAAPAPVAEPVADTVPVVGEEREYRGAYTRGFEASWFAPCGAPRGDARWWVTLTEPARLQRDSLLRALADSAVGSTGALAVRWRGRVGERTRAGHMGQGSRYMLVTEVLEVRPLVGRGFCGWREAMRGRAGLTLRG